MHTCCFCMAQVLSLLGKAVGFRGLVGGQAVDLKCEGKEVSAETLEYIHMHKTAALLEAAVVCGAIVGGESSIPNQQERSA